MSILTTIIAIILCYVIFLPIVRQREEAKWGKLHTWNWVFWTAVKDWAERHGHPWIQGVAIRRRR